MSSLDDIRRSMAAVESLALPRLTLAIWSLVPSLRPWRIDLPAETIIVIGEGAARELERELELHKPAPTAESLTAAIIPCRGLTSLLGVPVVNIDEGGRDADRLGRLIGAHISKVLAGR